MWVWIINDNNNYRETAVKRGALLEWGRDLSLLAEVVTGFQLRNSKCQVSLVECSRDYDFSDLWPMDFSDYFICD